MDRIPIKSNPKLFDKAIGELQKQIGQKLPWLDHIFGLCETLTATNGRKKFKSANVYIGNQQYMQIMPCKELGNFCFFMLTDPQSKVKNQDLLVEAPFYAVFWYDVEKVLPREDERNTEAIKDEILSTLNSIRTPIIEWNRIIENPEKVFADFSYDIISNQYMMSPYSGLKIEGKIRARISCYAATHKGDFNEDFNKDYNK